MGSAHFLSPPSLNSIFINPNFTLQNPNFSSKFCCSSSSRPNWGTNFDASQRRRFEFEDEFEFDLGRREKRRNWWFDDDDEDEDDDEFGFWGERSTTIDWFFKIFKAFGWMVPAVMVSTILGTGSNSSLIMALVLPLGQTALSLVMDKLWGGPSSRPNFRPQTKPRSTSRSRSRSRPKKNPSAGTANPVNGGAREVRSRRPVNGGYQSWAAAKKVGRSSSKFGGWDELDQEDSTSKAHSSFTDELSQKVDAPPKRYADAGKLGRTINRDKPLFIRLLIAVFPFLGSWTRSSPLNHKCKKRWDHGSLKEINSSPSLELQDTNHHLPKCTKSNGIMNVMEITFFEL